MNEMEQIRIESELERQKNSRISRNVKSENRDSGYDTNRKLKANAVQASIQGGKHSSSLLDISSDGNDSFH